MTDRACIAVALALGIATVAILNVAFRHPFAFGG